jgi:hypothetical protein
MRVMPRSQGPPRPQGRCVPLEALVSPYHLTTREAPAMVASLVCDSAVTFLPSPQSADGSSGSRVDLESFTDALSRSPRYRALLDSWAWCSGLWDASVFSATRDGYDPADHVVSACERLIADPALEPLRSLAQHELFDSVEMFLDLVSRDILRAGPNPGVSIPVAHGLDEFAFEQGMVVIRPEPASLVQRLESRRSRRIGAVSLPIVQQGDGRCVMEARDALCEPLDALRDAIEDALVHGLQRNEHDPIENIETNDERREPDDEGTDLAHAAQAYARAFAEIEDELARVPRHDEPRFVAGHVTLTLASLPRGVVFSSALAAGQRLAFAGASDSPGNDETTENTGRFAVLFVKSLGARAGNRR